MKTIQPPRFAEKVFAWYCRHAAVEDLHGDLDELFHSNVQTHGVWKARWLYYLHAASLIGSYAIRSRHRRKGYRESFNQNQRAMFRNYSLIVFRQFLKNKGYSAINITGLTIGMAVTLAIGLWIHDEVTFDSNHEHHARVAQLYQNVHNNGTVDTWTFMPWPLADELRKNYGADFQQIIITSGTGGHLISTPEKKFSRQGILAETGFGEMFSIQAIHGAHEITDASSILLSESAARAYFGDADPIGQSVTMDLETQLQVTGVYKDLPANSSFARLDFIAHWGVLEKTDWLRGMEDPWRPNAFVIYLRLADGSNFSSASVRIKDAMMKKLNEHLQKKKPALFLQPMDRWHLYSEFKNGVNVGGRIQYVWLFGVIGVFVLLMACINFMNLTTARSEQRSKEIGIRKSIGSYRSQLISQFFYESTWLSFSSAVIAIFVVWLLLPSFNVLTDKRMLMPWTSPAWWMAVTGFALVTGLLAGSYPALYLSSIPAGKAIKGTYHSGKSASAPRKVLVVLQFTISVILIVGTVTVFEQIRFAQNRPVGFNRDALISSPVISGSIHSHFKAFEEQLLRTGAVISAAEASHAPATDGSSSSGFEWSGKDPSSSIDFVFFGGSAHYGRTVGWEIADGRDFDENNLADSSALILNEAAVQYMGLKDPVGETIRWFGTPMHVIGVIRDIVYNSPYETVTPTVYHLRQDPGRYVVMRMNPDRSAIDAIPQIENVFRTFNPSEPFSFQFADAEYATKFGNENRIGMLAMIFTALAIVISCLGIFGLASFVAERRTKEIGIRKVLGASVLHLWQMLSKEFVLLVAIALILALPLAAVGMNAWLSSYSYRTSIPWWIFAFAATGALGLTILTVSFQSIKAALSNPVNSLRSE